MFNRNLVLISLILALLSIGYFTASAQCGTVTTGNDNITCTTDSFIFDTGGDDTFTNAGGNTLNNRVIWGDAGNDSITNDGVAITSLITGKDGNDTLINNGTLNDGVLFGENDDDLLINNGTMINGVDMAAATGNDTLINNGYIDSGTVSGLSGDDQITNNGTANNTQFMGLDGNDTLTNVGDAGNSTFDGGTGDDVINIRFGTAVGLLRGGEGAETIGDILNFTDLSQAIADAITAGCPNPDTGCLVNVNGFTYDIAQFEGLNLLVQAIIIDLNIPVGETVLVQYGDGGNFQIGLATLCDDGRVKVFRLANGDLEVFSGFWFINVPNGFLVGRVVMVDWLNGIKRFQDTGEGALNPGWYVIMDSIQGNRWRLTVYDDKDQPIGGCYQ